MKLHNSFSFSIMILFLININAFGDWTTPLTVRTETDLDYHAKRSVATDGNYVYVSSPRPDSTKSV